MGCIDQRLVSPLSQLECLTWVRLLVTLRTLVLKISTCAVTVIEQEKAFIVSLFHLSTCDETFINFCPNTRILR